MSIDTLSEHTYKDWQGIAERALASAETRLFIDGPYVDSVSGGRFETINPANRNVLASVSQADGSDVDNQLSLAAGVVQGNQTTWPQGAELGKENERRREFNHVVDTMDTVAIKQGFVGGVDARHRTRIGDGQFGRPFGASDLQGDNRYFPGNGFDEGDMMQPFGGYKQSGNARDKCVESLLSYTQGKSAWLRLS